jgi:ATP-dependent Clp protease protease subunit
MRRYADTLEKIDGNIAGMYEKQDRQAAEHYRALMDAETWFTAEEAKAEGLVDTVYTARSPPNSPPSAKAVRLHRLQQDSRPRAEMWGLAPAAVPPQFTRARGIAAWRAGAGPFHKGNPHDE